jgi:hypothetical protein
MGTAVGVTSTSTGSGGGGWQITTVAVPSKRGSGGVGGQGGVDGGPADSATGGDVEEQRWRQDAYLQWHQRSSQWLAQHTTVAVEMEVQYKY